MQVLNQTIMNTALPKVVEIGEGFLFNGQYYTKDKLIPIPFQQYNVGPNAQYNMLQVNKRIFLNSINSSSYYGTKQDSIDWILADNNNPGTYYVSVAYHNYSNSQYFLYKINETNNIINSCTLVDNAGSYCFDNFIGQSDDYIFYTCHVYTYPSSTAYIKSINKKTNAVANITNFGSQYSYPKVKVICENTNYIWTVCFQPSSASNTVNFYKINKLAATVDTFNLTTGLVAADYGSSYVDDIVDFGGGIYGVYFVSFKDTATPFRLYTIDTNKIANAEVYTMQTPAVTWNTSKTSFVYNNPTVADSMQNEIHTFIVNDNGQKYLNVIMYTRNPSSNATYNQAAINQQGLYTFKFDDNTHLSLVSYNQIDNTQNILTFLTSQDRKTLIIGKMNSFYIYKFDATSKQFIDTGIFLNNIQTVGFDKQERLWYLNNDNTVEMTSLYDAASVDIVFEKKYYEYLGSNIDTYIDFSVVNYLNQPFGGTFELTITGSAVFKDTGTKTMSLSYNLTTPKRIPISITGASQISIYTKYITTI